MRTYTYTQYQVSYKGMYGHFQQSDYSKYHDRRRLQDKGELPEGEQVYGYTQALEHIEELKLHIYHHERVNKDKEFEIHIVSGVVTEVPIKRGNHTNALENAYDILFTLEKESLVKDAYDNTKNTSYAGAIYKLACMHKGKVADGMTNMPYAQIMQLYGDLTIAEFVKLVSGAKF